MPRNNTQEFTTVVTGASLPVSVTGAAVPDSQMTPRNVTVFLQSPDSRIDLPQEDDQPKSAIRERGLVGLRNRFLRKGKKKIGVGESLRAIALSSWLNIWLVFLPFAWIAHFSQSMGDYTMRWGSQATFCFCFFAIVPLARLLHYGGEQMLFYLGKDLGDLTKVTLSNAVEATLAIILLHECELRILKSTILGVVILHLLLVPGTAFVIGGARIIQQDLHPHTTQLNQSLLTMGVLAILIPAAFFAAIDTQYAPTSAVSDKVREHVLTFSRGLAILLLIVYVCSRIYLHNPPGEEDPLNLAEAPNAPDALKDEVLKLKNSDPEINQWVCIVMLIVTLALMATTAEWLVQTMKVVHKASNIEEEWFGLILLPIVSFAADGTLAIVYFIRYLLRHFLKAPVPPTTLARGEAIDLSIQFVLFWMPFLVLLAWWTGKPFTLLFDLFQVAILVGACFLVNYVTADSKTNWAEGVAMVMFYIMIALCAWFYSGQPEMNFMAQCGSVEVAIANYLNGTGHE